MLIVYFIYFILFIVIYNIKNSNINSNVFKNNDSLVINNIENINFNNINNIRFLEEQYSSDYSSISSSSSSSSSENEQYDYEPKYGPEEGETIITINYYSNSIKNIDLNNNNINSYCLFNNEKNITSNLTKDNILNNKIIIQCSTPSLNSFNNEEEIQTINTETEHYSIINFNVIINDLNINLSLTFIYNLDVKIFNYFPNNIDFNSDNLLNIYIISSDKIYYEPQNLKCKFIYDDGSYIIIDAHFISSNNITCKNPKIDSITTLTNINLEITFNNQNYYNQVFINDNYENILIYYRPSENIQSFIPSEIPLNQNFTIKIILDYYFDANYSNSTCALSNNNTLKNSEYIYYFKTYYNENDPNNIVYCDIPIVKNLFNIENGDVIYLGISSNNFHYIEPLTRIQFSDPIITSLNKHILPINHNFNLIIYGNNFINKTTNIIFYCDNNNINNSYIANFINNYQLEIENINLNSCKNEGYINISLVYDNIIFYNYIDKIYIYLDNIINNIYPNIIHNKYTDKIYINFENKLIKFYNDFYCQFINNDNIITNLSTTKLSNHLLSCDNINSINFENYLNNNENNITINILLNREDNYINESYYINIILNINLSNVENTTTINTYSLNNDIISINGTDLSSNLTYYLSLNKFLFYDYFNISTDYILFNIADNIPYNNYKIYISYNLIDWIETNYSISINNELLCKNGTICLEQNSTIYNNILNENICPTGSYCYNGYKISCEIGTYNNLLNSSSCIKCPLNYICNYINLIQPLSCPNGYICNQSEIYTKIQLYICPKGYYCSHSGIIGLCSNGYYCPIGTYSLNYKYNTFGFPQKCKDHIKCLNLNSSYLVDNQYGNELCPLGFFCINGISFNCTNITTFNKYSYECLNIGLSQGDLCLIGSYNNNPSLYSNCQLCTIGSYCPLFGTITPMYCPGGRICEFTGQHRSSDYCLSDYFCINSTIGFPTNKKNKSTIEYTFYPQECDSSQFCIGGIKTSILNDNDPEAPHSCKAGYVCSTETTLCPMGYYCPGNSEPIPADEGYYVPGTGFSYQLPCAPGYYQNLTGQSSCVKCPAGTYTYLQAQILCSECEAGTFRDENSASISCILCPEGTYNEKTGSTSVNDCINCPAGYLCDIEGMSDFNHQSKICPTGYVCGEGTNSLNIELCPQGFYCSEGTSELYQYHICIAGYYCDKGSTVNNYKNNPCLVGWYCPYGVYLTTDNQGNNILKISELIERVVEAKLIYNSSDTELELINQSCSDNINLPSEIISNLINENNLLCPSGTTSKSGAKCIGECIKDEKNPSYIIDPFYYKYYDYYSDTSSNRNNDLLNQNILDRYITVKSYEIINIIFNFSFLPNYIIYNKHYCIEFLTDLNNIELDSYINETITNNNIIQFKIFNFNNYDINLQISILFFNSLFSNVSDGFLNSSTLSRFLPNRAVYNTTKIFPFLLKQSLFTSSEDTTNTFSMPYNFYLPNKGKLLISYIDYNLNLPSHGYSSNDPFNYLLFDDEGINHVLLPYIPFFSNCYGYDKYMYLFNLIENEENCTIPNFNDILVVGFFPIHGFNAKSDECSLEFKCKYDELNQNVISNKWFSLTANTELFYVSRKPYTIQEVFNDEIYINDEDEIKFFKDFIPVTFKPNRNGVTSTSCFPYNIEIVIQYYQINKKEKKLVNFHVEMSNYSNCINLNLNEEIKYNGEYKLNIIYYPLNYFGLLDHFQFSYFAYALLILSIGILLLLIFFLHLMISNWIGKIKGTKYLNIKKFFYWFLLPYIRGIIIAVIPAIGLIVLLYGIEKSYLFYNNPATWNIFDAGGFNTEAERSLYNYSRTSIYFFFIALYCYGKSIHKMIPYPDEEKILIQKEIGGDNKDDKEDNISDNNNSFSSSFSNEEEENNKNMCYDDIEVDMTNIIDWKQKTIFMKYLIITSFVIYKMNFIFYSENYNLLTKIFILNLMDFIFEELCIKFFFLEALNAIPIITLNRVSQFLYFLGSQSFAYSLICYIFLLIINSIIQLYINPIIDKIEYMILTKIKNFVNKKNSYKIKGYNLLKKFINVFSFVKIKNIYKEEIDEKIENIRFNENKNKLTIESVLRINLLFTIKLLSLILTPLVIFSFYIFSEATVLNKIFHLENNGIFYYLVFSISIIFHEILIQMLITNYIEGIYGFRIQDYLGYCNFRYKMRNTNIIDMSETMDISINTFYRSLDSFLFSDQLYYVLFYSTMALFCELFGFIVSLENEYNPFNDPSLIIFISLFIVLLFFLDQIFKLLFKLFGIFKNSSRKTKDNRNKKGLEFLVVDANLKDMTKYMTTNDFRDKFIKINREWLVQNLELIFDMENIIKDLNDLNEDGERDLEKIYKSALNYQVIDNEIQLKKNLIKKDLDLLPYNQNLIGTINNEFGIREDISKDSIIDEPNYIKSKIKIPNNKKNYIKNIALIWKSKADEILKYKKWSIDVLGEVEKDYCEKCNGKFNLHVFQEKPIVKIIMEFKKLNLGKKIIMNKWQKYYKNNQTFITLCMECGYLRNSKFLLNKLNEKNKNIFDNKLISDNNKKKDILNIGLKKPHIRSIIYLWLFNSRTKILEEKIKNIQNKKKTKENNNK